MITYRPAATVFECAAAFPLVANLDSYYPDFVDWYWNKVVPDTVLGRGVMMLALDGDEIVGAALGRGGLDAKLRCVRVLPRLASRGLGIHLIDRILRLIDVDRPELTVSEELIHDYSRIFINRFGFDLTRVEKGLYRPGRLEYQFNGATNHRLKSVYG